MPEDASKPAPAPSADQPDQTHPPVAPVRRPAVDRLPSGSSPRLPPCSGCGWPSVTSRRKARPSRSSSTTPTASPPARPPCFAANVNVGNVTDVELTPDTKAVVVTLSMTQQAASLLRLDTQIWVVKPRLGGEGISGLSTLVSGSYMELQPGVQKRSVPTTSVWRILRSLLRGAGLARQARGRSGGRRDAGFLDHLQGHRRREDRNPHLYPDTGRVEFGAFINGDYSKLVSRETRFWERQRR